MNFSFSQNQVNDIITFLELRRVAFCTDYVLINRKDHIFYQFRGLKAVMQVVRMGEKRPLSP